MIVGYVTMLGLNVTMTRWEVTWRMILLGVGLGPALPLFTLAIQNAVDPREIGAATSSSQFFRQIGSTIGVAVFGTLMATTLAAELPRALPAELRQAGLGKMSFSMGQLQSGNDSAVGDQIKAGMDDVYGKVELALTRDDAAATASLLSNPLVPEQFKGMLQSRQAGPLSAADSAPILARVRTALDAQAASITTQVTSALKQAFTTAVRRVYLLGLCILAAGFLVTLFLPELALRKSHAHAPAPAEASASAEG